MITPEQVMRIAEDQWEWVTFFENLSYAPLDTPGDFLRECRRELSDYLEQDTTENFFTEKQYYAAITALNFIIDSLHRLGVVGHRDSEGGGYCEVCVKYLENVESEHGPWYCTTHTPQPLF